MTVRSKLILAFSMVASVPLVGGAIGLYAHRCAMHWAAHARQVALEATQILAATEEVQVSSEQALREPSSADAIAATIRQNLATVRAMAPAFALPVETIDAIGQTSQAVVKPSNRAASQTLANTVRQRIDVTIRDDDAATASESLLLELTMGIGTLFGIALGIGFGIVTSIAVTRHIREIAKTIWVETGEVASSVTQVAASSRDLAAASSQQAASLQETSASLIEVNNIVKTNADHARKAQAISHQSRGASDQSAREIADLQAAMKEISGSSANIAKIVQSIDEIAFQTNILALNAAVEAARAGEAGTGFAVVAEEVRSLAQRSASAARETTQKIDDALSKSTRGAEIAARVEHSLRQVIDDAHRVDDLIQRIAESSVEQAKGLDQAVHSVNRIDELTQGNAARAEQTAAVAQELDSQAHTMRQHLAGLMDNSSATQPAVVPAKTPAPARSIEPLPV